MLRSVAGGGLWLAAAGTFPRGYSGWVGERGPEWVDIPGATRITPNHVLGGITQINNFAPGVSRADLMPALAQIKQDAVSAMYDLQRRGVRRRS